MKWLFLSAVFSLTAVSSIYNLSYTDIAGNNVSMSQYQGKWILLVNIATEAPEAAVQIRELEQFYQLHKDSVAVIGFPSNDFGNEPRAGEDIRLLMERTYHASFPVAAVSAVKGGNGNLHPVFNWVAHQSENGRMDIQISKDFQKILIDRSGNITGFFGAKVRPQSPAITQAMEN